MWPFLLCSSFERMTEKRKQYDIFRVFEKKQRFPDGIYVWKVGRQPLSHYVYLSESDREEQTWDFGQ